MPGSVVRRSAYIAPNVVLMPSFVNVGAYVDKGTMVDTWATVGSCAQIGENCHLSGGVGIGGVLEPLQAEPVIIEDNCFIGARSEVVEGVIVEQGSVLAMGTFISATTKIVDRNTGADPYRPGAGLFGGGAGFAAGQSRCPTAAPARASTARSSSRPSTSRPAPRPRSTNLLARMRNTALDPAALAAELIRRPSVTPRDEGALDIVAGHLEELGFTCHRLVFGGEDGSDAIVNLYARYGARPAQSVLCRAYRCGAAGNTRGMVGRPVWRRPA